MTQEQKINLDKDRWPAFVIPALKLRQQVLDRFYHDYRVRAEEENPKLALAHKISGVTRWLTAAPVALLPVAAGIGAAFPPLAVGAFALGVISLFARQVMSDALDALPMEPLDRDVASGHLIKRFNDRAQPEDQMTQDDVMLISKLSIAEGYNHYAQLADQARFIAPPATASKPKPAI